MLITSLVIKKTCQFYDNKLNAIQGHNEKKTKHEQQRTYVKNKISALSNYFTCQTKAMVQCNLCISSCLATTIR